MTTCTILILTYKGKHHLEYLLPTVQKTIDETDTRYKVDVLIVDNGCDDATRDYVRSNFPSFEYKYSQVNDYLFSLNPFTDALTADFMLMLNDDMKLKPDVLNKTLPVIEKDHDLFAVTCRIMDWDGKRTVSAVRQAVYQKGWMRSSFLLNNEPQIKYTLYPSGGAAVFRVSYYQQLGGFDNLYRPAYCEDADLGIRAWQMGWKVVYHPGAVIYHREGGTINDQFKQDKLDQTIFRNTILWNLKNVRYPGFLMYFFLLYPNRLLFSFMKDKNYNKALRAAIASFPKALKRRRTFASKVIVNDKEWLPLINMEYVR